MDLPALVLGPVVDKFATLFFSSLQGFKNLDLTPGEAFAIICHYEAWTGEKVDPFKMDFEEFGRRLEASDFNLHDKASIPTLLEFPA